MDRDAETADAGLAIALSGLNGDSVKCYRRHEATLPRLVRVAIVGSDEGRAGDLKSRSALRSATFGTLKSRETQSFALRQPARHSRGGSGVGG